MKIPMDPWGIEPATFRLVGQLLDQLFQFGVKKWWAVSGVARWIFIYQEERCII
jgi:hypothetical protein